MKRVALLGSTGSIGESTLSVLRRHREEFAVTALVTGSNADRLAMQVAEWRPAFSAVVNGGPGSDALIDAATRADVDIVVNAVVGAAGLEATLAALEAGKRVALANKESLVMAGPLVAAAARRGGGEIVPVDSEHSAVLQCIASRDSTPTAITLTASGGPFRTWDAAAIVDAGCDEALRHPTWQMGAKITIDSATLANKALEVIEAHALFGLDYDRIGVVVHPQSIIHAMVAFADGSMLAQMGYPSMEIPILYALTHPRRSDDHGVEPFNPLKVGTLTFEELRRDAFPTFDLGVGAGRIGGTAPAAFNAANEVAVAAFLDGRIRFGRIPLIIEAALRRHGGGECTDLAAVRSADAAARRHATEAMA